MFKVHDFIQNIDTKEIRQIISMSAIDYTLFFIYTLDDGTKWYDQRLEKEFVKVVPGYSSLEDKNPLVKTTLKIWYYSDGIYPQIEAVVIASTIEEAANLINARNIAEGDTDSDVPFDHILQVDFSKGPRIFLYSATYD